MDNIFYFLKILLSLVLSLPVAVLFQIPFLLLILLPSLIARFCVGIYVKMCRADLVRFVDVQSTPLALDDMSGRPISTLLGIGLIKGQLTLVGLREAVNKYIMGNKTYKNKPLHFPEFRQYYKPHLGFLFWKEDKNFSIENHVNLYEHDFEYVDEKRLLEITKTLERKPFTEKRSPWEILLVKNCNFQFQDKNPGEEEWALIYRMHHGLADGYSLIKKVLLGSDLPTESIQMPLADRRTFFGYFAFILAFLYAPYELCWQILNFYDRNAWHLKESEITREWHVVRSKALPVELVKAVKNRYNVAFTDVLMASITGGIRSFFLENNPKLLPKSMHAVVGQPWPNHPWRMCNHWTYGFLELPLDISDALGRLQKCQYNLQHLKNSLTSVFHFALLRIVGSLPNFLVTKMCRNFLATMVISNIPAPKKKYTFLSGAAVIEECFFWNGLTRGNLGIGVAIVTYHHSIHFTLTVDKAILATEEEVEDLTNKIVAQVANFNNM